jgi:DNA invertase Pin-like site-specific DNA recombinase
MTPVKKKVGIYCRVSTLDQQTDLQIRELTEYVAARGWTVYRLYEDKATGTNKNRPMLKELLRDARARKFDVVLVWKLDRFARSLKDLITMLQELTELGIDFVSQKDQIDLTTAAGRLMVHIIGAFAEFEAAIIKERVMAGIKAARDKGKHLGRPKLRDDAAIARLRAEGVSIRKIAALLGLSAGAIQRSLNQSALNSPASAK